MTFWMAFLGYLIPTFPLGYFWHLKTFSEDYQSLGLYRDDVIIPMGLASMVIQALFFAWVFPKVFDVTAGNWVSNALAFTAIFGTLAWSFLVLPVAAKYKMASVSKFMMLETAFTAIQFAVTGTLISYVYSR